jgi:hypothetical protein
LDAVAIHALLAHFFGENPNSLGLSVPLKECKDLFDKYNEADRVEGMKKQLIMDMFHKPFYVVSVDGFDDISVGKLRVTSGLENGGSITYEIIEPLRRYSNVVEGYPDIIPILTMTKVTYERDRKLAGGYIPVIDTFNTSLNAAFSYAGSLDGYTSVYMVTPC